MSTLKPQISEQNTVSVLEKLSNFMKQPWMSELLERTFMYDEKSRIDGVPYNTTFFQQIGWYSYEQWENGDINKDKLLRIFSDKMKFRISELDEIIRDLKQDSSNTIKSEIEIEWINYMILSINTAISAAPIELEKSTKTPILSDNERQRLVDEVEKWQEKLYGPKLSENLDEIMSSLEMLCEEYYDGKQYLTPEQDQQFKDIYNKLIQQIKKKPEYKDILFPDLESYKKKKITVNEITNVALKKAENIDIPREIYMKLWQQYIDAMWLRQKVLLNPGASSLYDGPDSLDVPDSTDYEDRKLIKVLSLMTHEISAHYVNQSTTENNGFQIRWAWNVVKEEWLAVVMEWLLEWKKLSDLKWAAISFPYILAWELLSKEDRQLLVDLRIRMDIDVKWKYWDTQNKRDLRLMRWYPLDYKWAQRKDCSYWRWKNKIIDLLLNRKCSILDLFKWKFSIEEILSGRIWEIITKENTVFPLLFPEMLIFLIAKWRKWFTHAKFIEYLKEKYKGDVDEEDLNSITVIKEFSKLKVFIIMWREINTFL